MSISFLYPQLLVLLLLLPLVVRYLGDRRFSVSTVLRLLIAVLAVLALSRPSLERQEQGRDLILLVDRSASCGDESEAMLREILPLIAGQAEGGDRTAVVAFGDGVAMERGFGGDVAGVQVPDEFPLASDLAAGLNRALALRDPARRTAVLCLTDGRYTGYDPRDAANIPGLDGLPFWYRRLGVGGGLEVAAGEIVSPGEVQPRSAWPVRYAIYANAPCAVRYALRRNGAVIGQGTAELNRGENAFFAGDTSPEGELLEYTLEISAEGDGVQRNNRSTALVRVGEAPRVLLVTHAREPGLLGGALAAAAIPVDAIRPEDFPDAPALLFPYKLVVLENCQLTAFPGRGVGALAEAVRSGVSSLLVTGGPNSLGMGGYHRSLLDPLLPVEMELRNETRRGSMAIAMALDRSGSMSMTVGPGRTKMDLANLGAAESIRLLSPFDQVSVIAVDSSAHLIVPLSVADDVDKLVDLTLSIRSMGGGIFCRTALEAAAREVRKSSLSSRHIILFADASDAEEQEGCVELAKELRSEGIGLSVVAMGGPYDSDAEFLRRLADAGGGEALFSSDAAGLPALFTQEIMRISKRGFIEEPVTPRLLPALTLMGVDAAVDSPHFDGYNIGAAREGAVVYMLLDDEFQTPLMATRGVGRTSAGVLLFEVDGEYSGDFRTWPEAVELLVALALRLSPGTSPDGIKAYSSVARGDAMVAVEFSLDAARMVRGADNAVRWLGPGGTVFISELEWLRPEMAVSRMRLTAPGHYLPLMDFADAGMVAAPAVSLSYSPEFAASPASSGQAVLRELAELTGGGDGLDIGEVLRSARYQRMGSGEITRYLLIILLTLFLLELSGRRLLWFK